ncbi:hypothetical protein OG896_18010 [Streptomyces sp. NBC_00669]|uniref:hypothetical protein n=1 Tax=unclassified Streptomyces TaxID=2593676 RepID=UPI002E327691|nr:hypothetical protein [Streptomyces sp. NBC_00669]
MASMETDEARRTAVAHFTEGGSKNAGWTVTGPAVQDVQTATGSRPSLVFTFRAPASDAWNRRSLPLRVAVDAETGTAETLR